MTEAPHLVDYLSKIAPLVTLVGIAVGWLATYLGWERTHKNMLDIESKKFAANLELERQKFLTSLDLDKKRAELKFVSDQIQLLYGPLFSLGQASRIAFDAFMKKYAPGRRAFFDSQQRTPDELEIWRRWVREVWMPLNLLMERSIIENSHLIEGPSMPKSFQAFLGHVASYKAVLKKWDRAETPNSPVELKEEDHYAITNFPTEMAEEVERSIALLRAKQIKLLTVSTDPSLEPAGITLDPKARTI